MKNIDKVSIYFVIFLLSVCIYIKKEDFFTNLIVVNSNGYNFKVRDESDKQQAAQILYNIHKKIDYLCKHLKKVDPDHYGVQRLVKRYHPSILRELHKNSSNTSYSVNKGEKLVVCMRSKKDDSLHDENTIFFVVLHELAHIMSKSIGHNDEFWKNFKYLLKHSIKINIYNYENFNDNPKYYCGINITDTPYKL